MPKLSGCLGFSRRALRSAIVASSMAGAICDRSRGFTDIDEPPPRAEHHLKLAERDDRELVLRLAEQRAALGADADDAEMHAFDLDHLVERIDVGAEQAVGRLPAEHDHRPRTSALPWGSSAARARRRSSRNSTYSGVTPVNLGLIDRFVAIGDAAVGAGVGHHGPRQTRCSAGRRARRPSVMRGLLRTLSNSSSLRVMPNC